MDKQGVNNRPIRKYRTVVYAPFIFLIGRLNVRPVFLTQNYIAARNLPNRKAKGNLVYICKLMKIIRKKWKKYLHSGNIMI